MEDGTAEQIDEGWIATEGTKADIAQVEGGVSDGDRAVIVEKSGGSGGGDRGVLAEGQAGVIVKLQMARVESSTSDGEMARAWEAFNN